ncbi:AmmeMemoRadiSam system protein B [Acidobacteriota bacterium]
MTRLMFLWPVLLLIVIIPRIGDSAEQAPTRAEVEKMMGLGSEGDRVRGQMDTVGFVVEEAPAEDVVSTAVALEHEGLAAQDRRLGMAAGDGFVGGICPHDDHLYAGRVYVHLTERITAPRVLLIGVFHRAKMWELRDRIVFDQFDAWHGPWGPIEIDPMREKLVASLQPENFVVDNAMHCREHSLEALVPFLQRGHPDRTIVPILVPHMGWDRMTELTDELSTALASIMQENGWRLGTDIAVVVSSDAVHYGPDFNHAPFGTDTEAYDRAVARDLQLVDENLSGPLESAKLHRLLETLVDPETLEYRLPWCGRFSIPFGLELLRKVSIATEGETPYGSLLRSGTSLSEAELPVSPASRESGLGYTAPSNLHHWVGYEAIGYLLPD